MSTPARAHTSKATPRAWPSLAAADASFAKNSASTLASSGVCVRSTSISATSIATSRVAIDVFSSVCAMPCAMWMRRVPRRSTTPHPKWRVPGSSPSTTGIAASSRHRGELARLGLAGGLLERVADAVERVRRRRQVPLVARVGVVVGAIGDGDLHELVFGGFFAEDNEALALERPRGGACRAHDAVVLLEDLADLGDRAVSVVGHRLDEEERAGGTAALVHDLFVRGAFELARAALHGSVDRVVGHRLALGVEDGLAKAGITRGIAAAHARGNRQLLDELREELPALCVESALLVLDGGPFRMAAHGAPLSSPP